MNSTIFFSACSLLYCILLLVIFKVKKKTTTKKTNILKALLLINLFGLIFEVLGIFLGSNYEEYKLLNDIVLKLILVYYFTWIFTFIIYIMIISNKDEEISKKKMIGWTLIYAVVLIMGMLLPLDYNTRKGVIIYTSGPAINLVYFYSLFCDAFGLFMMFKNAKDIKGSKYAPLFVLISFGTIISMIQSSHPELLLSSTMQTFVTYIIYFTIEDENNASKKIESSVDNNAAKCKWYI